MLGLKSLIYACFVCFLLIYFNCQPIKCDLSLLVNVVLAVLHILTKHDSFRAAVQRVRMCNYMNKKLTVVLATVLLGSMYGCGGSDGGGSTTSAVVKPTKLPRAPLEALDINNVFTSVGSSIQPNLYQVEGHISLEILHGEDQGVVSLNENGELLAMRPGTAEIRAHDESDTFESSDADFTVIIQKGWNPDLEVNAVYMSTAQNQQATIMVRGAKGDLSYDLVSGSENLITVSDQGVLTTFGKPGVARVTITDSGNDYFTARSTYVDVVIRQVDADTLDFSPLTESFRSGLTLEPNKLDTTPAEYIEYQVISSAPDNEVIEILDTHSGLMRVKNTGRVIVEATAHYSDTFKQETQSDTFTVTVNKGLRKKLESEAVDLPFIADQLFEATLLNQMGPVTYELVSGQAVLNIDVNTGLPKIIGTGDAEVRVSETELRNFQADSTTFDAHISKATHPGLVQQNIELAYSPDLRIPFAMSGQQGNLTLKESDNDNVKVLGDELLLTQAGKYALTFIDDGGDNYLSAEKAFSIQVNKVVAEPLEIKDFNVTYENNLQISLYRELNAGMSQVEVVANSNVQVVKDLGNGILQIISDGEATLKIRRAESTNYLPSSEQSIRIHVAKADSPLTASNNVTHLWQPGVAYIAAPTISGSVGELSYYLSDDSQVDVVTLDEDSGSMKVLNAGSVTVIAKDSGAVGINGSEVRYTVEILPADNPVVGEYLAVEFKNGISLEPVLTQVMDKASYKLSYMSDPNVKLINAATGQVEVLHAGEFKVSAKVSSRNYKNKTIELVGRINKAEHPGVISEPQRVAYAPEKTFNAVLPSPKGTRSYTLENGADIASIDPNSGVVTLNNYVGQIGDRTLSIRVVEAESRDYLATNSTTKNRVLVTVQAPSNVDSDWHQIVTDNIVIPSRLNDNKYSNLDESQFEVKGYFAVREPSDGELKQYGLGKVYLTHFMPEGETDLSKQVGVSVYIRRFDGCRADIDAESLDIDSAINGSNPGYCLNGETVRYTSLVILDAERLEPGRYLSVKPMSIYRHGSRKFYYTPGGGDYLTADYVAGQGWGTPSNIYEWMTFDMVIER